MDKDSRVAESHSVVVAAQALLPLIEANREPITTQRMLLFLWQI